MLPSFNPSRNISITPSVAPTINIAGNFGFFSLFFAINVFLTNLLFLSESLFTDINAKSAIVSSVFNQGVVLIVELTNSAVIGGSIYCTVAENSSPHLDWSSLYGLVSFSSYSAVFAVGDSSVTITVTGLRSLNSYAVACASQVTSIAAVSSYDVFMATRQSFTTICCETIAFTSIPVIVFNVRSLEIASNLRQQIFRYQLSQTPLSLSSLFAVPVLRTANGLLVGNSSYEMSPSSFAISSSSSTSQSLLLIVNDASLTGTYYIDLVLSGSASGMYTAASTSFQMISYQATSVLPSKISSIRYSFSLTSLTARFDSDTNYGNTLQSRSLTTAWNCSLIFQFASSNTASCSWINASAVFIRLSSSTSVSVPQVSSNATLRESVFHLACSVYSTLDCGMFQNNTAQQITVFAPFSGGSPVSVFAIADEVNPCSTFAIDNSLSTGSGGRPWKAIYWNVTANSLVRATSATLLQNILNAAGETLQRIQVAAFALDSGKYTLTLTLVNFIGLTASTTKTFTYSANTNVPSVAIAGPSEVEIQPRSSLSLASVASLSACVGAVSSLNYTWTVYQSSRQLSSLISQSRNPKLFLLSAYSLTASFSYTVIVKVVAASLGSGLSTASATMTVKVVDGAVIALIAGGETRIISQDAVFDASGSYDENVVVSVAVLTYTWSCALISLVNYGQNCDFIFDTSALTSSRTTVFASSLNSSESYSIKLLVAASDGRYGISRVFLQKATLPGASITTSIISQATSVNLGSIMEISSTLQSTEAIFAEWSVATSTGTTLDLSTALTTSSRTFPASPSLASGTSFPLKLLIPTSGLSSGTLLTFSIRASSGVSGDTSKYVQSLFTVKVNIGPYNGVMTVIPNTGFSLVTTFSYLSSGWFVDDAAQLPLEYDFAYSLPSSGNSSFAIQAKSSANFAQGYLSLNTGLNVTNINIVSRAFDSLSAVASSSVSVLVTRNASQSVVLSSFLETALGAALNSSDSDAVLGILNNAVTALLAPSSSSSDVSRRRRRLSSADCPSSNGQICSGSGSCQNFINGLLVNDCGITSSIDCLSNCLCEEGYSGNDCSLLAEAGVEQAAALGKICDTIGTLLNMTDASGLLLDSLVSTLITAVSTPAFDSNVTKSCQVAFAKIFELAPGNLNGSFNSDTTTQAILDMLSQQILPSEVSDDSLDGSLSSLVISFMETLSNGQNPLSLSSNNVQVIVSRSLVADIFNSSIAVGEGGTSITFATEEAASQCATDNGYIRLAMSTYSKNPFGATVEAPSKMLRSQIFPNTSFAALPLSSSNNSSPSFYVTLPFYQAQNFAKTMSLETLQFNETLPECTLYEDGELVSCDGCSVDHYTNDTVVFACYDVSLICGKGNAAAARHHRQLSRRLFSLSGDDDSEEALSTPASSTSQFAAIVTKTAQNFALVLSSNPFAVDIKTATPVIAFVGSLMMILILGALYFSAWDLQDYQVLVYARPQDAEMMRQVNKIDMQSDRQDRMRKNKTSSAKSPSIRSPISSISISSPRAQSSDRHSFLSSSSKKEFRFLSRSSSLSFMLLDETNSAKGKKLTRQMTTKQQQQFKKRQSMLIGEKKVDFAAERKAITAFLQQTIPMRFSEGNFSLNFNRFISTLLHIHSLTAMFFGASMVNTRSNRWFDLCTKLLLSLFLDSLFFGTFFADNGVCQGLVDEESCEVQINTATGYPYCSWSGNSENYVDGTTVYSMSSCALNRPPNDLTYTLIISLLCFTIALPIDLALDYIRLEICSRRLDLSFFRVKSSMYFGSPVRDMLSFNSLSVLDRALGYNKNSLVQQPTTVIREIDLEAGAISSDNYVNNNHRIDSSNANADAEKMYQAFAPLAVEAREMISEVRSLIISSTMRLGSYEEEKQDADGVILNYDFVEQLIGFRIDGSPAPLTFMQQLRFRSQSQRLEVHLQQARIESKKIVQSLDEMPAVVMDDLNTALLQFFVLEQFSAMKRYVLRYQYFDNRVSGEAINPFVWLGGWFLLSGCLIFFIYWIYAWCLASGGAVIHSWAINFILVIILELVILQVGQVLVIYFIATQSIEPQLMAIKKVIQSIAVSVLMENKAIRHSRDSRGSHNSREINSLINRGPASSSGFSSIVQHISPACRASYSHKLQALSAARILRSVRDHDMARCRDRNEKRLYFIAVFFIALPALFAFFGDAVGGLILDAVLPSTTYLFIIANYRVLQVSPVLLVALYLALLLFYVYKFLAVKPAVRKLFQKTKTSKARRSELKIQRAADRSTTLLRLFYFFSTPFRLLQSWPRRLIDYFLFRTARKKMLGDRLWRNINRPERLQCSIATAPPSMPSALESSNQNKSNKVNIRCRPESLQQKFAGQMNIPGEIMTLLSNQWDLACDSAALRVRIKENHGVEGSNEANQLYMVAVIDRLALPFTQKRLSLRPHKATFDTYRLMARRSQHKRKEELVVLQNNSNSEGDDSQVSLHVQLDDGINDVIELSESQRIASSQQF